MFRLFFIELYKIACKPRSYIGFIAIGLIAGLIHFAMYMDGKAYISVVTQPLEQSFNIEGNILNGNLVAFIILQLLIIHVPLLIALVTGDLMSGEADSGTLRLLSSKPVSRFNIIASKFFAGACYTFAILLFFTIVSLGIGLMIFGKGDLIVVKSDSVVILQGSDVLWRFIAALMMAFISLMVVASLSFMLSCFANNSIGPIITTMAIIILFTIICGMDLPVFDGIRPWLFTAHSINWRLFFDNPVPYGKVMNSFIVLVVHIIIFFSIGLWHFNRKDILV